MSMRSWLFVFNALLLVPCRAADAQSQPGRVIALGGDITEIVYRLGEQDRLGGRDATSTFPAAAQAIPAVGYFRQLGAEGVLSLKPDLILASASAGPPEVLQQIVATGVAIVQLPDSHTPEGLLDKVDRIAKALDVPERVRSSQQNCARRSTWRKRQSRPCRAGRRSCSSSMPGAERPWPPAAILRRIR
jgi:ABC-type hemin transport system substrate-binding protein